MMRKSVNNIVDGLGRVARFMREVADAPIRLSRPARARLHLLANWLDSVAAYILRDEVEHMRIANIITGLEQQRDAARAQAAKLQAQLDAQAPNIPDAADLAAMQAAEAQLAADTTLAGGAGGDTTTGGTDTTGGGAGA